MSSASKDVMEVRNLLVAALLLVGGARLVSVDLEVTTCVVRLDTSGLLPSHLGNSFEILSNRTRALSDRASLDEITHLYSSSVLGSLEKEYMMLKRAVARAKTKKPPCPPS